MTRMPNHVVQHLIDLGVLDRSGITRRAKFRPCPRCDQLVAAGLDHDTVAMNAIVDPTPLAPAGELTATLTGRGTWTLRRTGDRYAIDVRWPEAIAAHPAGSLTNADVVAEHRCHAPPLAAAPSRISSPPQLATTDTCPF